MCPLSSAHLFQTSCLLISSLWCADVTHAWCRNAWSHFVHLDAVEGFNCLRPEAEAFNMTWLEDWHCSLFGRKLDDGAADAAEQMMRSCSPRMGMQPPSWCVLCDNECLGELCRDAPF